MRQIAALPKPVAFIGIDPALGVSEGDELSQAHQRRLGELVDHVAIRTGACTMLSAHATKGSMSADEVTSHTSRGGGAITDALRGEHVLRNMTGPEAAKLGITDAAERRRHVQLVGTKAMICRLRRSCPCGCGAASFGMLEQVTLEQAAG